MNGFSPPSVSPKVSLWESKGLSFVTCSEKLNILLMLSRLHLCGLDTTRKVALLHKHKPQGQKIDGGKKNRNTKAAFVSKAEILNYPTLFFGSTAREITGSGTKIGSCNERGNLCYLKNQLNCFTRYIMDFNLF